MWGFVAHASSQTDSNSSQTTGAANTIGSDIFVVYGTRFSVGVLPSGPFSDSNGNSYITSIGPSGAPEWWDGGSLNASFAYCAQPTTSSSMTWTQTTHGGTQLFGTVVGLAFSGSAVSPFETLVEHGVSGGATSLQAGLITPADTGELLVACLTYSDVVPPSIDSGFSTPYGIATGIGFGAYTAYLFDGSACNPTWTWPDSGEGIAVIASFKGVAVSGFRTNSSLNGLSASGAFFGDRLGG